MSDPCLEPNSTEAYLVGELLTLSRLGTPNKAHAKAKVEALVRVHEKAQSPSVKAEIREEIRRLEDRWGTLREKDPKKKTPALVEPSDFAPYRKYRDRFLRAMHHAAILLQGEPHKTVYVVNHMLVMSGLVWVNQVTQIESMRQWLLRTGVAVRTSHGMLASGPRCELYADGEWEKLGVEPPCP